MGLIPKLITFIELKLVVCFLTKATTTKQNTDARKVLKVLTNLKFLLNTLEKRR